MQKNQSFENGWSMQNVLNQLKVDGILEQHNQGQHPLCTAIALASIMDVKVKLNYRYSSHQAMDIPHNRRGCYSCQCCKKYISSVIFCVNQKDKEIKICLDCVSKHQNKNMEFTFQSIFASIISLYSDPADIEILKLFCSNLKIPDNYGNILQIDW